MAFVVERGDLLFVVGHAVVLTLRNDQDERASVLGRCDLEVPHLPLFDGGDEPLARAKAAERTA